MQTEPQTTRSPVEGTPGVAAAPAWHYLLLLLMPLWLTLVNPNWAYQNLWHMDAWYYFGDFRHFPRLHLLSPNYASERLPWVLSGWVMSRIFGQVNGVFALHCLVLDGSLFFTHYLLRRVSDCRTAFLGTLLMACYPCFIGANGWDYVDSMQILLLVAAISMLVRASLAPGRAGVWLFGAGMAWCAIIYIYVPWIAFSPIFFGLALFLLRPRAMLPAALRAAAIFGASALAVTAVLAAFYRALGGVGFFYQENVATARSMSKLSHNPWIVAGWYREPTWLIVPFLALCMALLWVGIAWLRRNALEANALRRDQKWVLWFYLLCFAVMIGYTIDQNRLLASDHHMSIIIPVTYLTFCVTALRVPKATSQRLFYTVALMGGALSVSTLAAPQSYHLLLHWQFLLPALTTLGALAFYTCLWQPRGNPRVWAAMVVLLGALSSAMIPGYPAAAWKAKYSGRELEQRVSHSIDVVLQRLPPDRTPVFWFDNEADPLTPEFRGIVCSFVAHTNSMNRYPTLDPRHRFTAGERLFILAHEASGAATAAAVLTQAGVHVAQLSQDRIELGGVSYWILQLQVVEAG